MNEMIQETLFVTASNIKSELFMYINEYYVRLRLIASPRQEEMSLVTWQLCHVFDY